MSWCKTCGDFMTTVVAHKCHPAWRVWSPTFDQDEDDGARRVFAFDAEEAAEAWADRFDRDCADYPIVGGSEAEVHVRYDDDPERARTLRLPTDTQVFVVTGETVPSYTARSKS